MGLLDKLLGGAQKEEEVVDIEEFLDEEADVISPPADFYVKKLDLRNEGDAELVIKEVKDKNIIILNVTPIAKQPKRFKRILMKLKTFVEKVNGDIAMISKTLFIITPERVKIVKARK